MSLDGDAVSSRREPPQPALGVISAEQPDGFGRSGEQVGPPASEPLATAPSDNRAFAEWLAATDELGVAHSPGPKYTALAADYLKSLEKLASLRAELEVERRKDHAYGAWTDGYSAAMADYAAGRTGDWPKPSATPSAPERQPETDE